MHLFHCATDQPDIVAPVSTIFTPLGTVQFQATIREEIVSSRTPSAIYRLVNSGWAAGWYDKAFDLELLVCRPTLPTSFEHIPDALNWDCWAGIWRLQSHEPVAASVFAAVWEEDYTWHNWTTDSGQFVYAKTWDNGQTQVTIGTQDTECLALRAEQRDYMPEQLREYFCKIPSSYDWRTCPYWKQEAHERLREIGVPTPLPPLPSNQLCQLHFVVAWANHDNQSQLTWLSIDRNPIDILMGAGCL